MSHYTNIYHTIIGVCTLGGGVLGSSMFAYESRRDGPAMMFGASVFGGVVGVIGGAIAGASTPIAVPGLLIATAFSLSDYGSKKLIKKMNHFTTGQNGSKQTSGQAPPPGSPSAPVSI